jgi:ubiquinone/menaquinone biosynthesis C-methylase UbiE
MYQYTPANAKTYNTLGIKGTTYQLGFDEVSTILGDLHGKVALDFGTGTGRTARLLHALRAEKVYGVDHNQTMINQATASPNEGIDFMKVDDKLPFNQDSFDVALAAHVFVEVSSLKEMRQISSEVYRVLKPGGSFIVIANKRSLTLELSAMIT